MEYVLLGGLWLTPAAWDEVVAALAERGHTARAVLLPGQGDGNASATLGAQLDAAVAAIDACAGPCVVVGHSASGTLAWMAADRRPEKVAKVALIGAFPSADGEQYAAFFPIEDGQMAFPGWESFEGPDSDDLSQRQRGAMEKAAVPVPEGVAHGRVRLTDDRRYDIPVVMICPEFSEQDAKDWVKAGDVPELARAKSVSYIDLDSGHWPMISKPAELAEALASLA